MRPARHNVRHLSRCGAPQEIGRHHVPRELCAHEIRRFRTFPKGLSSGQPHFVPQTAPLGARMAPPPEGWSLSDDQGRVPVMLQMPMNTYFQNAAILKGALHDGDFDIELVTNWGNSCSPKGSLETRRWPLGCRRRFPAWRLDTGRAATHWGRGPPYRREPLITRDGWWTWWMWWCG